MKLGRRRWLLGELEEAIVVVMIKIHYIHV